MTQKKYSGYVDGGGYYSGERAGNSVKLLPSGIYTVTHSDRLGVVLEATTANYDQLIDLPSDEYTKVLKDLTTFLKPETKTKFQQHGFVYKRSAMLHGKPGTGKTCIVNRVAEKVAQAGGVILFNPPPYLLEEAFKLVDNIENNRLIMVIFEEFEELLKEYEDLLLSLLDGEVQKDNVMYLATTNHIDKVPARIMRPGRFSSIVEVGFPSFEARLHYLKAKVPNRTDLNEWATLTEGFSVDELKETVLCVECLEYTFEEALTRIVSSKGDANQTDLDKRFHHVTASEVMRTHGQVAQASQAQRAAIGSITSQKQKYGF